MIKIALGIVAGFLAGKIYYDRESSVSKIAHDAFDGVNNKVSDVKDVAKEALTKSDQKKD